jgi:hypothetical protein
MSNVNNRYREYNIALPPVTVGQIKALAKEAGIGEVEMIRQLIAIGLVSGKPGSHPETQ